MDRLRKYKVNDLVECVDVTPWNVERLCLGAYYSIEGSTFLVDNVVYSLKSLDTGHIFYSIDRFERVGEVVKADEKVDLNMAIQSEYDKVNHPKHYLQGGKEVIDIIEDATKDLKGIECVCIANVIKYVLRYQFKNGVTDLKKARFYLDKVIKKIERDNNKGSE
jgi:hypothetical protein